jgi:hypothetical protein
MNAHARRWLKPLTGLVAVGVLLAVGVGSAAAENNGHTRLTLVKNVINDNGGWADAGDFTLMANATGGASSKKDFKSKTDEPHFHHVYPDVAYALSEKGPGGYAPGAWWCNGVELAGSTITLKRGENVTCTITNDDIAPILHLRKVVDTTENGGSAVPADFVLTATAIHHKEGNDVSGRSPVDSNKIPDLKLQADTWNLSENVMPGYTPSDWVCEYAGAKKHSKLRDHPLDPNQVKLRVGQAATCTITNTSQRPTLHLRKIVNNTNGGAAVATDFTLTATGTLAENVLSGVTPVDSGKGENPEVKADTFTLSETGPPGYAGTWACDNTEPAPDTASFAGGSSSFEGNTLLLYPGEDVTCTVTNTDIAPVLQLRKVVINDNGGVATSANFPLTATGSTPENSLTGVSPVDSTSSLKPDTWTLSEATLANYTASAWVCVGGTQVGSTVAVGIGETAVCTITNDDIAPAAVIAPPVAPVVAPPASVRGTATLRSPQGCVAGTMALTRLTARNVDHVVFIRDGRFAKRVNARGTGLQSFSLSTNVQKVGVHKVTARVFFATGATPRVTNLTHRFAQCRISPVTG